MPGSEIPQEVLSGVAALGREGHAQLIGRRRRRNPPPRNHQPGAARAPPAADVGPWSHDGETPQWARETLSTDAYEVIALPGIGKSFARDRWPPP
jgi:hypothetical protein